MSFSNEEIAEEFVESIRPRVFLADRNTYDGMHKLPVDKSKHQPRWSIVVVTMRRAGSQAWAIHRRIREVYPEVTLVEAFRGIA